MIYNIIYNIIHLMEINKIIKKILINKFDSKSIKYIKFFRIII